MKFAWQVCNVNKALMLLIRTEATAYYALCMLKYFINYTQSVFPSKLTLYYVDCRRSTCRRNEWEATKVFNAELSSLLDMEAIELLEQKIFFQNLCNLSKMNFIIIIVGFFSLRWVHIQLGLILNEHQLHGVSITIAISGVFAWTIALQKWFGWKGDHLFNRRGSPLELRVLKIC